jgi:ribosomal protein L32
MVPVHHSPAYAAYHKKVSKPQQHSAIQHCTLSLILLVPLVGCTAQVLSTSCCLDKPDNRQEQSSLYPLSSHTHCNLPHTMSFLTRRLLSLADSVCTRLQWQFMQPALAGLPSQALDNGAPLDGLFSHLWLAVPKRKVTRSRKRMKTTIQKRIPLKRNIVTDRRTGETTLMHKLPFNWKDYLPKIENEK